MIRVIRIDGMEILLNASLVEAVKHNPGGGSVVILGSGEQVLIKNNALDVFQKIDAFRQGLGEERKLEEKAVREKERDPDAEAPQENEEEKKKENEKERDRDHRDRDHRDRDRDRDRDRERPRSRDNRDRDRDRDRSRDSRESKKHS